MRVREADLVCQICGRVERIQVEVAGDGTRHVHLPDGWMPIWVEDDKQAKMTCGGCRGEGGSNAAM